MPIPPSPPLDETISPGQAGHIADHQVIADTLNDLTGQAVGQQGTAAAKPSNATMVAAGNRTGWTYYSTDWKVWWRFNGTVWVPVSGAIGFKARRDTTQSIANNGNAQVQNIIVESNDQSVYDGTSAFVCPTALAGRWQFGARIEFVANATGYRVLNLFHGAGIVARGFAGSASGTQPTVLSLVETLVVAAGDAVVPTADQNSGGALNLAASAHHTFWGWYEGP